MTKEKKTRIKSVTYKGFSLMGFEIEPDKYQFTVKGGPVVDDKKVWSACGYYKSLEHALWAIRQHFIRSSTIESKTLDVAIERIAEFNKEFNKAIAPLKKLED